VPVRDNAAVTESGKPANTADGMKFLRQENGSAVYEVAAGTYRFGSQMN
jgi:alpha-L-rhamnosidase